MNGVVGRWVSWSVGQCVVNFSNCLNDQAHNCLIHFRVPRGQLGVRGSSGVAKGQLHERRHLTEEDL